jgi:iron complex outermembrane receptor protein
VREERYNLCYTTKVHKGHYEKKLSFISDSAFIGAFSTAIFAQAGARISGRVTYTENQTPLHGAEVRIVQLNLSTETDDQGNYKFENLPRRTLHHSGADRRFFRIRQNNRSGSKRQRGIDFSLQIGGVREQVTVTASGAEQSTFDAFQSVTALGKNEIAQRNSISIGEVLEREPGVAKRSFGPGTARPVIRGFDGDRVLVLQNGVRVGSIGSGSAITASRLTR